VAHCVCPWWIGWLLVSPLRRLWQEPETILSPYVREGMTVLEPGPGMGFFTLALARLVGAAGRVVAVDVQPRMLEALERRARKAGLGERVDTRRAEGPSLGVDDLAGAVDFVLAFAVVHELPDQKAFFEQLARVLKPGGRVLVSEPRLHVKESDLSLTVRTAEQAGLREEARPSIGGGRSVLLVRAEPDRRA
jgi:ubiquinone/menaquinone biosynthesis C-methylase UbiE